MSLKDSLIFDLLSNNREFAEITNVQAITLIANIICQQSNVLFITSRAFSKRSYINVGRSIFSNKLDKEFLLQAAMMYYDP